MLAADCARRMSYILRLCPAVRDGKQAWFFVLESVSTGRRRVFESPQALCAYLEDIIVAPDPSPKAK